MANSKRRELTPDRLTSLDRKEMVRMLGPEDSTVQDIDSLST
ncbi:hypothetical protein 18India_13 [Salmonella phage 18-India]|nr:hypothetical protein 18India_13 [Salmonella phage 18-India]